MTRRLETKFDECISCKHFVSNKCKRCDAGEFFEIEDDDEEPSDDELMTMFGKMTDEQ